MVVFCLFSAIQQQTPQGNTTATGTVAAGQQRPRAPTTPAPRQAGKACSASCVLFSYSCKNCFDLTAESFACTFFTCYVIFGTSSNCGRSRKPYGTPLAKSRSIALLILISPPHQVRTAAHTQAMTHAPFCPCLIGLPPTRSGSPLTSSIPLPVKLRAV